MNESENDDWDCVAKEEREREGIDGTMIVTLYFPFRESVTASNWSDRMRTIITQWMRDSCDGWRRVVRIGEGGRLESDCCGCCGGSEYGARIANSKSAHVFQMRRRMDRRESERDGGTDGRAADEGERGREREGRRAAAAPAAAEHASYQRIIFGDHLTWAETFKATIHQSAANCLPKITLCYDACC